MFQTDINGQCQTDYRLEEVNGTSLIISKKKRLSSCTSRHRLHSIIPTASYVFQTVGSSSFQQLSLICFILIFGFKDGSGFPSKEESHFNILIIRVHLIDPFTAKYSGAPRYRRQCRGCGTAKRRVLFKPLLEIESQQM